MLSHYSYRIMIKESLIDETSSAPAEILKSLNNGNAILAETTNNGTKLHAKLASTDGKLHLHSFKPENSQEGASTVQYDHVLSNLPSSLPTLLFLDLAHFDDYKGRVYIRLQSNAWSLHAFVRHVPSLFTGERGDSILGNHFFNWDPEALGITVHKPVKDIHLYEKDYRIAIYGDVVCDFRGDVIKQMFIHLGENKAYDGYGEIGVVESGMEVAEDCLGLGEWEQYNITISDCGVVLEM
ncbi:unnamed protein product [Meganyctiphanes norvegica]|uniref:Uncharacterized protein n=1 Tax=Meganyctiphanes norvegica TaxID=48144 RepID=A0AAV2S3Y7_MEGNR